MKRNPAKEKKRKTHAHPPQTGSEENGGECEREGERVSMRCQSVLSHQDEPAAGGVRRGATLGGESVDAFCGFKLRD